MNITETLLLMDGDRPTDKTDRQTRQSCLLCINRDRHQEISGCFPSVQNRVKIQRGEENTAATSLCVEKDAVSHTYNQMLSVCTWKRMQTRAAYWQTNGDREQGQGERQTREIQLLPVCEQTGIRTRAALGKDCRWALSTSGTHSGTPQVLQQSCCQACNAIQVNKNITHTPPKKTPQNSTILLSRSSYTENICCLKIRFHSNLTNHKQTSEGPRKTWTPCSLASKLLQLLQIQATPVLSLLASSHRFQQ